MTTARHRLAALLLAAATLALAGCASTASVQTQVSQFNQWPANAQGASFSVSTAAQGASAQWGDLQRQNYEQQLAQALQAQGLQPAAAGQSARFHAQMRLDSREDKINISEPIYGPPYYGPYGHGFGHYGWPHYWEDGVFGRRFWGPPAYYGQRQYQRPVASHLLSVRIQDSSQNNSTVYEANAQYQGSPPDINALMPYLIRSAFSDFPGQNGKTRQLEFKLPEAGKK